jgi:CO/xanthine dehydrogenase FAD-binding subunit
MLPPFDLLQPQNLNQALSWLQQDPSITPISGGSNLIVDMRAGKHSPAVVMDLSHLPELHTLTRVDGTIQLGSGLTINEILNSPLLSQTAPLIQQAAQVFANPIVRNRATLGGNLADGSPAADMAPPLLALDAQVTLQSATQQRVLPLSEFFLGVRKTALQPGELLTKVTIPIAAPLSSGIYYKIGLRKADAIAVVSAAVWVAFDANGRCWQAHIALGSVAPIPLRAVAAENLLEGQVFTEEWFQQAADAAAAAAQPISDVRASADYRRHMVQVLVRRLLISLAAQSHQE